MTRTTIAWAALSGLLLAGTASAQAPSGEASGAASASAAVPAGAVHLFTLEGKAKSDGRYVLALTAGASATRSVRVVAEPSGRQLLLALDAAYAESASGAALRAEALKRGVLAVTTGPLPGSSAKVGLRFDPAEDRAVKVWIDGDWSDGKSEERLVADAKLSSLAEFQISQYLDPPR